jgi:hypothetical protein
VHPDQHFLTYGPDGSLWVACDGGVWRRPAGGGFWMNLNSTLSITQFYSIALSSVGNLVGGTQDNGTLNTYVLQTFPWSQTIGGDGGPVAFIDQGRYLSTYTYLAPLYSWAHPNGFVGDVTGPWAGRDRADWAQGALMARSSPETYLVGTYRLWRSWNYGATWDSISGDLTGGGVLLSVSAHPTFFDSIWTASSDGRVFVGGAGTWLDRSTGLPAGVRLPDLIVGPHVAPGSPSARGAYVIADRSTGARVFESQNNGISWTSITGNLPPGLRPLALAADFSPEAGAEYPRLYVGTDHGLFCSTTRGARWFKISGVTSGGNGTLPDLAIYDLHREPVTNAMLVATHGRGVFAAFPDTSGPTSYVISPAQNDILPTGTVQNVNFVSFDSSSVDSVNLYFSSDGGASFQPIGTHIPNLDYYSAYQGWTLPATPHDSCYIAVQAFDGWRNPKTSVSGRFSVGSGVGVGEAVASRRIELAPIQPNPARAPVPIRFHLADAGDVRLEISDLAGRQVRRLAAGRYGPGLHEIVWSGDDDAGQRKSPGIYFARLRLAGVDRARRFVMVR